MLVPGAADADSTAAWLPPREEIESEDLLEEPPVERGGRGSVLARLGRSAGGVWEPRRLEASWAQGTLRAGSAGRAASVSVVQADGRPRPTIGIGWKRLRLVAGRVTAERAPALLARRLGVARSFARVPDARAAPIRPAAPVGASVPAVGGVAAAWTGRGIESWVLAGRIVEDGARLASAGLAARARRGDGALAAGWCAARPFLSLAGAWRGGAADASAEILIERDRRGALGAITTRRSGVELWCRWRYQSGEGRPVGGEAGGVARGRLGSARLTWRAWTSAARADNGALELEGSTALGPGRPVRVRLGERPGIAPGGAAAFPGGASPDRYALLDATLARAGSRSLAFLGSVRHGAGGRGTGRMLGARIHAGDEDRSRFTLLVQASRTSTGTPALSPELSVSGQSTLVERTRSGVVLAARGVARRGPLELGGVWEREEGAGGARPRSASVWVRWLL